VTLSRVGQILIQLGVTVVLARLVLPRDYGLIAMVTIFIGFAMQFVDSGLSAAIVQRKTITPAHLSAAFWFNVGLGVLIAGIAAAVAPLIALFYDQPRLVVIMPVLGFGFLLLSPALVQLALFQRAMAYRRVAFTELTSLAVAGTLAIVCAYAGLGVWSLVVFSLTNYAVQTCLLWALSDWRPTLSFDRRAFSDLWSFGSHLLGSTVLGYWNRNADNLLIGRFVGPAALGLYTRAYTFVPQQLLLLAVLLERPVFPALSRIQDDKERVRRAYLRTVAVIGLVTFPLALGLCVMARPFVLTALGSRWSGAIPLVRILSIAGLTDAIGITIGLVFLSQGRSDRYLRWQFVTGFVILSSFAIGIHWGAMGVATAYTIASVSLCGPGFMVAGRLIDMSLADVVRATWRVFAAAAVAAGAAWLTGRALVHATAPIQLLAEVFVAGAVYVACAHFGKLEPYEELRGALIRRRGGQAAVAA